MGSFTLHRSPLASVIRPKLRVSLDGKLHSYIPVYRFRLFEPVSVFVIQLQRDSVSVTVWAGHVYGGWVVYKKQSKRQSGRARYVPEHQQAHLQAKGRVVIWPLHQARCS